MFAYIKGVIQEKDTASSGAHRLVLECHGFGLEMQVSQHTFADLPEIGEEIQVHTVFVVKETEFTLFGFVNREEKELFLLLTSVSGIGPKLALALLSTFKPDQLSEAIIQENDKLITQTPGVGAKVAGRIVLELKSKITTWQEQKFKGHLYKEAIASEKSSAVDEEVRTILAGLGYSPAEIMHTLSSIRKHTDKRNVLNDAEMLVKESLKLLGAGTFN